MAKAERGDFGFPQKKHVKRQVVGIFDLVEFTELDSNKDLVQAVSMLQNELEMSLTPEFFWGDRAVGGREKETNNILLRSTGDGYVVAFSANVKPAKALQHLVDIHRRVHTKHPVRLGVNLGDNYVVADMNGFVNIPGVGHQPCRARARLRGVRPDHLHESFRRTSPGGGPRNGERAEKDRCPASEEERIDALQLPREGQVRRGPDRRAGGSRAAG